MLNESQKRALALLNALLKEEDGKRRVKDDKAFLTTLSTRPRWDERPDTWAKDWCRGWAFRPGYAHAEALGIALARRSRVIGHYIELCDGQFRPVPARDKDGKIKKKKNGATMPAPMSLFWMLWTQSTAFNFRRGQTIHAYGLEHSAKPWAEQTAHTPRSLQVLEARPAQPGGKHVPRDPGKVTFRILSRAQGYAGGEPFTATESDRSVSQDDFVRFLITGETA